MKRLKVSITGINANPGDVLIAQPKVLTDAEQLNQLYLLLKKTFPDCRIIILNSYIQLNQYRKEECIKFLKEQIQILEGS